MTLTSAIRTLRSAGYHVGRWTSRDGMVKFPIRCRVDLLPVLAAPPLLPDAAELIQFAASLA